MKLRTQILLTLLALATLATVDRAVHAVPYIPAGPANDAAKFVNPASAAPQQCSTVTLNGSVETIFTGTAGSCYLINTVSKDIFYFSEPATGFDGGLADATQSRIADPGKEKACLVGTQSKFHFFAAAATTATVCQTGP